MQTFQAITQHIHTMQSNGDQHQTNGLEYDDPSQRALKRPERDDRPFEEVGVFPDTTEGRLLNGTARAFLIKQEPRLGWARKGACDEKYLMAHPCEIVASHMWGVAWLTMVISKTEEFKKEIPNFDRASAYEMAMQHDLAELVTGDITPVDGIPPEEKHRLEMEAMTSILSYHPKDVANQLHANYARYEKRQCIESKLVKDCDRLDFMITAFVLERQGFRGFTEFYENSNKDFTTKIGSNLANLLIETRNKLAEQSKLYPHEQNDD